MGSDESENEYFFGDKSMDFDFGQLEFNPIDSELRFDNGSFSTALSHPENIADVRFDGALTAFSNTPNFGGAIGSGAFAAALACPEQTEPFRFGGLFSNVNALSGCLTVRPSGGLFSAALSHPENIAGLRFDGVLTAFSNAPNFGGAISNGAFVTALAFPEQTEPVTFGGTFSNMDALSGYITARPSGGIFSTALWHQENIDSTRLGGALTAFSNTPNFGGTIGNGVFATALAFPEQTEPVTFGGAFSNVDALSGCITARPSGGIFASFSGLLNREQTGVFNQRWAQNEELDFYQAPNANSVRAVESEPSTSVLKAILQIEIQDGLLVDFCASESNAETEIQDFHIDLTQLLGDYPIALRKINSATTLIVSPLAKENPTLIGLLCREAMIEFSDSIFRSSPSHLNRIPKCEFKNRMEECLSVVRSKSKRSVLMKSWEGLNTLVERLTHGGLREGDPVDIDDARDTLFKAITVFVEIHRAVTRLNKALLN